MHPLYDKAQQLSHDMVDVFLICNIRSAVGLSRTEQPRFILRLSGYTHW